MVEPVDPFQGRELDGFERSPRSAPVDLLGLVEAVDALGQGVVVAVADAADRRLDACLGEALGIADRDVLGAAIAATASVPASAAIGAVGDESCALLIADLRDVRLRTGFRPAPGPKRRPRKLRTAAVVRASRGSANRPCRRARRQWASRKPSRSINLSRWTLRRSRANPC